jgi:hypothetical protein
MKFPKLKKLFNIGGIFDETPFNKKISIIAIIILICTIFLTGRKVLMQNHYVGLLLFLQIALLSLFIKSFSGDIFKRIWNMDQGFVKRKWENLSKISLRLNHILLYLGIASLVMFHFLQSYSLSNSNTLLSYQQSAIGFVFLILFVWFLFGDRRRISFPCHVAITNFMFMIFIVVYDFLLFGVVQITGGPIWTGRLEVPLVLSVLGVLTMTFPEFFVFPIFNFKQIAKTLGQKT